MTVLAISKWPTNAALIEDVASLGYLRKDWRTLDCTYGRGVFWQKWQPDVLVGCDINPAKSPIGYSVDFTAMPFANREFDCVVIDGPYKLQGTPATDQMDERFGTDVKASRPERHALICAGITECERVLGDGYLLVKCQDQVNGGKVRWQSRIFADHAESLGLGLVDRLDILSYRPQPNGVRQVHARRNSSSLLIFARGHRWR